MATNAILRLQRRLLVDSGYPVLYTSRFTQDCIENLFSIIRSKQRRPTPLQFKSHLRTVTLSQYMSEVRNSSYETDDREFLSGFIDHLNCSIVDQQSNSSQSTCGTQETLDLSLVEISGMAKQILSSLSNAEANAMFHVAGYIMGSIKKNTSTCTHCLKFCITSFPFDKSFGKFSSFLASARGRPFCYASELIFHFIACMESIIQDHFTEKSVIDKSKIDQVKRSLMSLPLELPSCHNVKTKLIKRYVQFKLKADRVRKVRKRRFDSRSMLN